MDINISISDLINVLVSIRNLGGKILSQPLGFYRILITAKDGTSPGLMLHAWLDKEQPRQSQNRTRDIHSHTFNMRSRVLIGELKNELYNLVEDLNGDYQIAYIRQDGPIATRVITDTKVRMVLDHEEIVGAGESYGFPSKRFHCTVISEYPTITLMQKEHMISDNAVNILPFPHTDRELGTYIPPELDQDELWEQILSILKK
jgi:hypothetical protein